MTESSPAAPAEPPAPAPSDVELILRTRAGESEAFGQLYERHRGAAERLGRRLVPASDVDDLVSDAFARVLDVLRSGGGPHVSFRAYLLTTLRRRSYDRGRARRREQATDDLTPYDEGVPFTDTALEQFENSTAARAFASLPERWQAVLWHTEVEGEKPADVAPVLGLSANGVAALAYRAREGLRQAYLQMHLASVSSRDCRWTSDRLGAYTRGGLSRRETATVKRHLEQCEACTAVYLELVAVNRRLPALLGPIVLGPLAAGYAAKGGGLGGLGLVAGRVRDLVGSSPQTAAVAAGASVATVAAAAFGVIALTGDPAPPARPTTPAIAAPQAPVRVPPPAAVPAPQPPPKGQSTPQRAPKAAASSPRSRQAAAAAAAAPAAAAPGAHGGRAAVPAVSRVVRSQRGAAPAPAAPAPARPAPAPPAPAPAPRAPAPAPAPAPARAPAPPAPAPAPPAQPPSRQGGLELNVRADTPVADVDAKAGVREGALFADARVTPP
jgi:RNA polymerase sigma factor (sigma-70 family)